MELGMFEGGLKVGLTSKEVITLNDDGVFFGTGQLDGKDMHVRVVETRRPRATDPSADAYNSGIYVALLPGQADSLSLPNPLQVEIPREVIGGPRARDLMGEAGKIIISAS